MQLAGPRLALFLDAISFLISYALLIVFLKPRPAANESTPSIALLLGDLGRGWKVLMADPSRRALVMLGWGMALPLVAPEAVGLAYVRQTGEADTWGGILMASVVTGAAVGAVLVGRRPPREQLDLVLPLAMLMSPAAARHRHRAADRGPRRAVVPVRRGAGVPGAGDGVHHGPDEERAARQRRRHRRRRLRPADGSGLPRRRLGGQRHQPRVLGRRDGRRRTRRGLGVLTSPGRQRPCAPTSAPWRSPASDRVRSGCARLSATPASCPRRS